VRTASHDRGSLAPDSVAAKIATASEDSLTTYLIPSIDRSEGAANGLEHHDYLLLVDDEGRRQDQRVAARAKEDAVLKAVIGAFDVTLAGVITSSSGMSPPPNPCHQGSGRSGWRLMAAHGVSYRSRSYGVNLYRQNAAASTAGREYNNGTYFPAAQNGARLR
jgi:hypothetical protein